MFATDCRAWRGGGMSEHKFSYEVDDQTRVGSDEGAQTEELEQAGQDQHGETRRQGQHHHEHLQHPGLVKVGVCS